MLPRFDCVLLAAQATVDWWTQQFFGLDQGQRFIVLLVGIGCATGIIISVVAIVSGLIDGIHRRRAETEMKREMLDRGMAAEEIARVVESSPPQNYLERWASAQGKGKKG